jgi:hypothetical protein
MATLPAIWGALVRTLFQPDPVSPTKCLPYRKTGSCGTADKARSLATFQVHLELFASAPIESHLDPMQSRIDRELSYFTSSQGADDGAIDLDLVVADRSRQSPGSLEMVIFAWPSISSFCSTHPLSKACAAPPAERDTPAHSRHSGTVSSCSHPDRLSAQRSACGHQPSGQAPT